MPISAQPLSLFGFVERWAFRSHNFLAGARCRGVTPLWCYEPSAKLCDSVPLRRTILSWPLKIVQTSTQIDAFVSIWHQFSNAAVVASSALAFSAGEKLKVAVRREMLLIRDTSRWWWKKLLRFCNMLGSLAILQVFAAFQLWYSGALWQENFAARNGYMFAAPDLLCSTWMVLMSTNPGQGHATVVQLLLENKADVSHSFDEARHFGTKVLGFFDLLELIRGVPLALKVWYYKTRLLIRHLQYLKCVHVIYNWYSI